VIKNLFSVFNSPGWFSRFGWLKGCQFFKNVMNKEIERIGRGGEAGGAAYICAPIVPPPAGNSGLFGIDGNNGQTRKPFYCNYLRETSHHQWFT